MLATLLIHGLRTAHGRASGRPGAAANLFSSNDADGSPDYDAAPNGPGSAAEAAPPMARRCSATSSPPARRASATSMRRDDWYRQLGRGRLPAGCAGLRAGSRPRRQRRSSPRAKSANGCAGPQRPACRPRSICLAWSPSAASASRADRAAAAELYRQAAEKGNRSAQARWGLALMEGRGVRSEPDRGRILAAQGRRWPAIREAAALVGDLYAKGGPLPPNYAEAAMWFRRATEAGHKGAARALGHAVSDRRRRAARPAGGGALVPHLRRGRRQQGAQVDLANLLLKGTARQQDAHPHPRMVRAGGCLRRSGRGVQFRRLPGRGHRCRARRAQGRRMAAPGRRRRGQRTVLVWAHAGRGARRRRQPGGRPRLDRSRRRGRHGRSPGRAGRAAAERPRRSAGPCRRADPVRERGRARPCRRDVRAAAPCMAAATTFRPTGRPRSAGSGPRPNAGTPTRR